MGGHTYNLLSQVLSNFAIRLYSEFSALAGVVISLTALYLILLGLKIAGSPDRRGELKKVWYIFLVFPLACWAVFFNDGYVMSEWLIPLFAGLPMDLSIAIMSIGVDGGMSIKGIDAGFASLFQAIDALGQAADQVSGIWTKFKVYVALTALGLVYGLVYAIFFATQVLSMATIYVFLALAPPFIICFIYPMTRGFALAWLRELIKYGMMAPLAGTTMGLTINAITKHLEHLRDKVVENPTTLDVFDGSFGASIFMAFITIQLLRQVPDWAASLTGGTQSDNAAYSTSLNTKLMADRIKDSGKTMKQINKGIRKLTGRGGDSE